MRTVSAPIQAAVFCSLRVAFTFARGYKLAKEGRDTRAIQHYLGPKNIQHTVRVLEIQPLVGISVGSEW